MGPKKHGHSNSRTNSQYGSLLAMSIMVPICGGGTSATNVRGKLSRSILKAAVRLLL